MEVLPRKYQSRSERGRLRGEGGEKSLIKLGRLDVSDTLLSLPPGLDPGLILGFT